MGIVKCACGYDKDRETCKSIALTAAEKKQLIEQGRDPQDEYFYCPPCLRILQDPEQGPLFMRGTYERQLRDLGVPSIRAKALADKYYRKLKELQRTRGYGRGTQS